MPALSWKRYHYFLLYWGEFNMWLCIAIGKFSWPLLLITYIWRKKKINLDRNHKDIPVKKGLTQVDWPAIIKLIKHRIISVRFEQLISFSNFHKKKTYWNHFNWLKGWFWFVIRLLLLNKLLTLVIQWFLMKSLLTTFQNIPINKILEEKIIEHTMHV